MASLLPTAISSRAAEPQLLMGLDVDPDTAAAAGAAAEVFTLSATNQTLGGGISKYLPTFYPGFLAVVYSVSSCYLVR